MQHGFCGSDIENQATILLLLGGLPFHLIVRTKFELSFGTRYSLTKALMGLKNFSISGQIRCLGNVSYANLGLWD